MLTSIDEDEDSAGEEDALSSDEDEEESPDVLLLEAGHVLVDALLLKHERYAAHDGGAAAE